MLDHPAPAPSVRDAVHFTYDDHQAGDRDAERARASRTASARSAPPTAKYAFYFDPDGEAPTEYELYDLERDPLEVENLLEVALEGSRATPRPAIAPRELAERLDLAMEECGTTPRLSSAAVGAAGVSTRRSSERSSSSAACRLACWLGDAVTTADLPAAAAHTQVNPTVAGLQALLATLDCVGDRGCHLIQMRALRVENLKPLR